MYKTGYTFTYLLL